MCRFCKALCPKTLQGEGEGEGEEGEKMYSIMSSVLRKSIRLSLVSSLASIQHRSLSISSSSASSYSVVSSSLLLGKSLKGSSPFLSLRFSSSSSSSAKKVGADETLKRVLDSEIKCTEEESNQLDQGLPDLSPFEIVDNPGEQTITLKRELAGESIQVEVHMLDIEGEGEEDDEDDAQSGDDNDEMNKHQPNVSLIVAVAKGNGPHLEFCCTAYPDEITIDRMLIKGNEVSADQIAYEGLEFSDLDEELQKAFYKYLEVRGIKSSLTNSLQQYMVSKDNREYLTWLKNMKEFVAN